MVFLLNHKVKYLLLNKQTQTITVNNIANKTLYTNTTNYDAIVNVHLTVVYDIVRVVKNSGLIVGDRYVSLNPLVNTITFTGTFKVQPTKTLQWSMIHYSTSSSNDDTDNTGNPISINGSVNIVNFVE